MRWMTLALALAVVGTACGTAQRDTFTDDGGSGSSGGSGGGFGSGDDGSPSFGVTGDGGNSNPTLSCGTATITAAGGPNITVTGQPKSVQLTATCGGSPLSGTWTTSNTTIGTVSSSGAFTANGYVGGSVTVTLLVGMAQVTITLTVTVDITDNPAMLSNADQTALMGGGPANPSFKFLYPYDGTVFPRGLQTPILQFGDGVTISSTANATYLKLTTTNFSYQQFGAGGAPVRIIIPDAVWNGVTTTAGATDVVTAAVNERIGTTVTGPLTEKWQIAQGSLRGFIYYSTYKSPLLPPSMNSGGGILRIQPGSNAAVVSSGCVVCHSISANGAVLSAALGPDLTNPTSSESLNITVASPTPTPRGTGGQGQSFAFAALTPDGTLALTNGVPSNAPPFEPHGFNGGYNSQLVNTSTGAAVNSPSLTSLVHIAQTPAFSPDSKLVAFIDGDQSPAQRPLAMLSFDGTSVFSNLQMLRNETATTTNAGNASTGWTPSPMPPATPTNFPPPGATQTKALAWPSFTPDSTAIIYHLGDSFDSVGYNLAGANLEAPPQYAELRLIELAGGTTGGDAGTTLTVNTLNALNGRDASGNSVLPYGEAVDNNMNYEPNMMPLPVGGYFWVVFTSRRAYGNTVAPGRAANAAFAGDPVSYDVPAQDPWGSESGPSPRKKLWVAAIDINHADPTNLDPSHPAFYLAGQEIEAANMRAFAALAPCLADGATCEIGTDCCNGYCRQNGNNSSGAPILECVPPVKNMCSDVGEPCTTSLDCCDHTDSCINGVCATPPPTQ